MTIKIILLMILMASILACAHLPGAGPMPEPKGA